MTENTGNNSEQEDVYRPKSRMEQLQEEFHMSDSEVDGLTKFISSSPSNMGVLEVLEEMVNYPRLKAGACQ